MTVLWKTLNRQIFSVSIQLRLKRWATDWKRICAKYLSDKGFISGIYKELSTSTLRKWSPNKNTGKHKRVDASPKKIQDSKKHMRRCSTSLVK